MKDYENFKKLLEYFVAHLEFCVNKDTKHVGYINYIKPLIDKDNFKYSGLGHKEHEIQNQIKDWESYFSREITININSSGYKERGCYLNWKDASINVIAEWDNNKIVGLKIVKNSFPLSEAKDVMTKSVSDLGLFDEQEPNKQLEAFFNQFIVLKIQWEEQKMK